MSQPNTSNNSLFPLTGSKRIQDPICRSKKFNFLRTLGEEDYHMSDDERFVFRQILMDNGMSRGQIQAMIG